MDNILTATNIKKSFRRGKETTLTILDGLNIEIPRGEITLIVGASGAGKSTLLHILSGLDYPDSGSVVVDNKDIFGMKDRELSKFRNNKMGFVFQFHHLLAEFSAQENVVIPGLISGENKKVLYKRAFEVLDRVGLADRAEHKPAELSGGEQQRVAVARALINNPDIIFADEPTGNLDSVNSNHINELFLKLKNEMNKSFVIVTHNPEMKSIADRIIEMKDGKIISVS